MNKLRNTEAATFDTDSDNCMIKPPSNITLSDWVATCGDNGIDIAMKCFSEAATSAKEALRRSNGTVVTNQSLLPTRHAFQAHQGDKDHVLCCTNMPERGTRRQLRHLTCRLNDERMDFQLFGNKQEPVSRLEISTLMDAMFGTHPRHWIVSLKLTSPCSVSYDEFSALNQLFNLTRLLITDAVLVARDSYETNWAIPDTVTHLTLQNHVSGLSYGYLRVNQVVVVPKSLIHLKLVAPRCTEMSAYCSAEATPNLKFLSIVLSLYGLSFDGNIIIRQPYWPKRWPTGLQSIVCQLPQGASRLNGGVSPWPWNLGNLPPGIKSVTIAVHQYTAEIGHSLLDEPGLLDGSGLPPSGATVSMYGQAPKSLVSNQPVSDWVYNRIRNGRQLSPARFSLQDRYLLSIMFFIASICGAIRIVV